MRRSVRAWHPAWAVTCPPGHVLTPPASHLPPAARPQSETAVMRRETGQVTEEQQNAEETNYL